MVSLRIYYSPRIVSGHFCAGFLINSQYVITAAHCVEGIRPSRLAVIVGLHTRNLIFIENLYTVSKIAIHQNWNPNLILNDVAIIKLRKNVTFSSRVSPICLPTSNDSTVVYNKKLVITGWGRTHEGNLAPVLQQGVLKVINGDPLCTAEGRTYDDSTNYCAFDDENLNLTSSCVGDSGGPLQLWDGVRATVYGIVSYGYGNSTRCFNTVPSYYTNVPAFLDWILEKIKTL
jgi:secreted trypsin-like serine protease